MNNFKIFLKTLGLIVLFFTLIFLLFLLDSLLKLGVMTSQGFDIYLVLIIFLMLLIGLSSLRKDFLNRFAPVKTYGLSYIYISICISAVLAMVMNVIRYVPFWISGEDLIGVGSKQITSFEGFSIVGRYILTVIVGPFNEEFLFRYLSYGGLFLLIKQLPDHPWLRWIHNISDHLFVKKTKIYIIFWVLLTSTWFSLVHGPNLLNFFFYFFSGVVYGVLFLKYGLLSSWTAHGSFNLFSNIMGWLLRLISR